MKISLPHYAPMLAKPCAALPSETGDFAAEVKWDGIRAMAYVNQGTVQIVSRSGLDITFRYPELELLAQQAGKRALILDGEIIAFSEEGTPSFSQLQKRMNLEKAALVQTAMSAIPITFIIFDILQLDTASLIHEPYVVRRQALDSCALSGPSWSAPPYQTGNGAALLAAGKQLGLEGIVLKKLDSPYLPGKRSDWWLKVKNFHRQEFVIGGWTAGEGKRSGTIGALLLGYYEGKKLRYAGSCGTGFSEKTLTRLKELCRPLTVSCCPFDTDPQKRGTTFIKPLLVAEISFTEWTPAGTLRHPSFLGLRQDKQAAEVVKELP